MELCLTNIYQYLSAFWNFLGSQKDQVSSLVSFTTVLFAYLGLRVWRSQFKGQTKFQCALTLLKTIYHYRSSFLYVRNSFMSVGEYGNAPDDMPKDEAHYLGTSQAYQKRWDKILEARSKVNEALLDAEVLWGKEIIQLVSEIFPFQGELYATIHTYLDRQRRHNENPSISPYLAIKEMKTMYGTGDANDEFHVRLELSIKKIENFLKPFIKI